MSTVHVDQLLISLRMCLSGYEIPILWFGIPDCIGQDATCLRICMGVPGTNSTETLQVESSRSICEDSMMFSIMYERWRWLAIMPLLWVFFKLQAISCYVKWHFS